MRADRFLCTWPDCGKTYSKACKLEEHLRSHTNTRPFICNQCGKSFLRNGHLKRHHTTAHTDEKAFICLWPDCKKAFSLKHHLRRHQRSHEDSRPFRCSTEGCDAAFTRKEQLKKHLVSLHGGGGGSGSSPIHTPTSSSKLYLCGVEGCASLTFDKWSSLLRHRRQVHSSTGGQTSVSENGVVFACPECEKTFSKARYLGLHTQRLHASFTATNTTTPSLLDRKAHWICNWVDCGKQFSSKNALKVHRATVHEGVKAYGCEKCERRFGHKHLLIRHRRTHEEKNLELKKVIKNNLEGEKTTNLWLDQLWINGESDKPLGCPFSGCNCRYGRQYDLQRHLAAAHWEALFDQLVSPLLLPNLVS